jgi:hypothetical protein
MNTDLEQRIRDHYAKIADELTLAPIDYRDLTAELRSGVTRLERFSSTAPRRRTRWLTAASLVIVLAGLATIAGLWNSQDSDSPNSEIGSSPVLLSEVTDVGPTDWVIATTLPDDLAWMYGRRRTGTERSDARMAFYGTTSRAGTFERLRVWVTANTGPSGGESVEIAGATWTLDTTDPGRWTARRELDSSTVVVHDSLPFDDADRNMLAGLIVVPELALPTPSLGNPDRYVDVAKYELDDTTYTLSAQESNGYWCFLVDGSGGCSETILDLAAAITFEGSFATVADGASTADVVQAGTTTSDTARIEVEFNSGAVVAVTPTDLSGRFGRKFWTVAATTPVNNRTVLEVRAYDTDNQLLATTLPS